VIVNPSQDKNKLGHVPHSNRDGNQYRACVRDLSSLEAHQSFLWQGRQLGEFILQLAQSFTFALLV